MDIIDTKRTSNSKDLCSINSIKAKFYKVSVSNYFSNIWPVSTSQLCALCTNIHLKNKPIG